MHATIDAARTDFTRGHEISNFALIAGNCVTTIIASFGALNAGAFIQIEGIYIQVGSALRACL
jgi:hypothetical protein